MSGLDAIRERAQKLLRDADVTEDESWPMVPTKAVKAVASDTLALAARLAQTEEALRAASEDARVLVQDYYSGLPEHRLPVDGAVARLAHLFERDEDGEARTVDEIVTEGLPARAALAGEQA